MATYKEFLVSGDCHIIEPPDLESCEKTVPPPVTGRVDRCWDVVRARWREHCFIRALIVLPQAADRIRHFRREN